MRKLITTKKDYLVQNLPAPDGSPDRVLIKHKGTDKTRAGDGFKEVMSLLLVDLTDHYGWKVLYKDI